MIARAVFITSISRLMKHTTNYEEQAQIVKKAMMRANNRIDYAQNLVLWKIYQTYKDRPAEPCDRRTIRLIYQINRCVALCNKIKDYELADALFIAVQYLLSNDQLLRYQAGMYKSRDN